MMTDDALHGKVLISGDGIAVGEIVRLIIDTTDWRVRGVEVRMRKDAAERIGVRHGFLRGSTIEIPIEHVQSVADAVILGVPLESLRAAAGGDTHSAEPASHPT